ncbi:PREDICTED: la-related protein 7 [Dufourea novaeangliae]|uniref:la-related protein 7 n=1 Tax=Dufourea novaeangliae TaxID=178035 RepID=UPI0007671612|nr:PREDICTED: la-related protein 7 [Dufourea novaeangliae]
MVMEEQQSDMELDSERVPVPQVQKPVENSHIDRINKVTSISRGKPRLRKKALNAAIRKQIEFYFSDANLSKDRFLNGLVKNDPYIDLSIFIAFNRIKELTTDISRINKALQTSTMLSLSEDGTKVRRITPIVLKENTDECTVYVQNLPPDADHEMLSTMFSQYGVVDYVSVPRYKQTKKIKGFAFVEFDTPESANKCLQAFEKKGCVLPSHTAPDELLSITTFSDTEKDVTLKGRPLKLNENKQSIENTANDGESDSFENNEEDVTINNTSKLQEKEGAIEIKKRKLQDTESSEAVETENEIDHKVTKHRRMSTNSHSDELKQNNKIQNNISTNGTPKKSNEDKKCVSTNKEEIMDNGDESDRMIFEDSTTDQQEDTDEKKKKRKRKRRSKVEDITFSMGLQVMAKKNWKHLRNKYLELQRSKMKQLKQHLRKPRWNQWSNYEKNKLEKEDTNEKEKMGKQEDASSCRFSFTPGVIVKIEMDKPCTDPKAFKMELKGNSSLKYIDVAESSFLAFVRCDTAEAAQTFIQKSNEERHMTILEGKDSSYINC